VKPIGKLVAIIAQLSVLVHVSAKFGIEAGLLTLAAIILNAVQEAYSE
jgi:hypothetical protein